MVKGRGAGSTVVRRQHIASALIQKSDEREGRARSSAGRLVRGSPCHIKASGLVSGLARSATCAPVMFNTARGLAKRWIPWTLDRKPRVANLLITHSTAPALTGQFVALTTCSRNIGLGCLVDLPLKKGAAKSAAAIVQTPRVTATRR